MRAVTPGRIAPVTQEELKGVIADCAARTERAAAMQKEAVSRQEAATAKLAESQILSEQMLREYARRTDEMVAEGREWMKKVTMELNEQRDERRALLEAIFRVMDRLD